MSGVPAVNVLTSMASTALMSEEHVLGRECMTSLILVSTTCMHVRPQSLLTPALNHIENASPAGLQKSNIHGLAPELLDSEASAAGHHP